MLVNATQSDMDIVFVGTASCTPGLTRGVSCTALRLNWRKRKNVLSSAARSTVDGDEKEQVMGRGGSMGKGDAVTGGGGRGGAAREYKNTDRDKDGSSHTTTGGGGIGTWLFDCGESTQLSVQRTTSIKPGRITKIFLTHCHGDHTFGLPGLLCLMGTDRDHDNSPPVEIYGPEGLRMWLRVAIRYSVSRVVPPYRVHELMDVPMAPDWVEGHRKNGRYYYQWKSSTRGDGEGDHQVDYDDDEDDEEDIKRNRGKNSQVGIKRKAVKRWGMQGLAGGDPMSWISRAPMMNLAVSEYFDRKSGMSF